MGDYRRCPVVFNLNNKMHLELYNWCLEQSTNFSSFVRSILFVYMRSQTEGVYGVKERTTHNEQSLQEPDPYVVETVSDADAMAGLL